MSKKWCELEKKMVDNFFEMYPCYSQYKKSPEKVASEIAKFKAGCFSLRKTLESSFSKTEKLEQENLALKKELEKTQEILNSILDTLHSIGDAPNSGFDINWAAEQANKSQEYADKAKKCNSLAEIKKTR